MSASKKIGALVEDRACSYLQAQGLILKEKNYRLPFGEIDLIMQDQDYLVFVEVRYRKENSYCSSIETITPKKQKRIIRAALFYLQQLNLVYKAWCRFDVVGVDNGQLTWIKNAFTL